MHGSFLEIWDNVLFSAFALIEECLADMLGGGGNLRYRQVAVPLIVSPVISSCQTACRSLARSCRYSAVLDEAGTELRGFAFRRPCWINNRYGKLGILASHLRLQATSIMLGEMGSREIVCSLHPARPATVLSSDRPSTMMGR